MKFSAGAVLLAAITLTACMGPQGNPDRQPYANEPGGAMAAQPAAPGKVAYDPYASPTPFADMQTGQAAINPPPPMPMPMPAPSANPPRRNR